jgi:hypothetical protein
MAKNRSVPDQRVEVWQEEDYADYTWCVSIYGRGPQGDSYEEACLLSEATAMQAVRFAIREARRRKLPWGVSDRFSHYTDFTRLPLRLASWAVSFIELEARQRHTFIEKHLLKIEREEEEDASV